MPVNDDAHPATSTWTPSASELTRCQATTRGGWPCRNKARIGGFCGAHHSKVPPDVMAAHQERVEALQKSAARPHRRLAYLIDDLVHGFGAMALLCAAPFLAYGAMLALFWILSVGTALLIMAAD
jgi:hypothetical protein